MSRTRLIPTSTLTPDRKFDRYQKQLFLSAYPSWVASLCSLIEWTRLPVRGRLFQSADGGNYVFEETNLFVFARNSRDSGAGCRLLFCRHTIRWHRCYRCRWAATSATRAATASEVSFERKAIVSTAEGGTMCSPPVFCASISPSGTVMECFLWVYGWQVSFLWLSC